MHYDFLFDAKHFQRDVMVAAELLQPGHLLRVFGAGGDQDLIERVPGVNLLEIPAAAEYRESVDAQPVKRRVVIDDSENPGGVVGLLGAVKDVDEDPAFQAAAVDKQSLLLLPRLALQ